MDRKIRMGMIGGGRDAFIGSVHRIAANIDGLIDLTCAALSADPEKAQLSGKDLFLDDDRIYNSYHDLFAHESTKGATERIDFVSIVTPNFAHFEPAMLALENGFHVLIDKPMALSLAEAKQLAAKAHDKKLLIGITYTYSAYPMVKQARQMVKQGDLGTIRKVVVTYPQGWLSSAVDNKQANWRTDPAKSGKSGCMGDIGTHAAHLAEYITGLKIEKLCADLNIVVAGRKLDDDGNVLLKFSNGAKGILMASQIATGEENALSISVYGEKGGMEWHQMEPNTLVVKWPDKPSQLYRTGGSYISVEAQQNTRTPAGHPEGYLEAFANIYRNFAKTVAAINTGETPSELDMDFPTAADGVRGMAFIENVLASAASDQKWWDFKI